MKPIRQFTIGSEAFFSGMAGFVPHDRDELCIMDSFPDGVNVLKVFLEDRDILLCRDLGKEAFLAEDIARGVPMAAGKYLVPEFAAYLGLDIDDLARLAPLIDGLDAKHEYERVIYEAYRENGAFTLTAGQRESAFEKYKEKRQTI